jgi:hypothetical protein
MPQTRDVDIAHTEAGAGAPEEPGAGQELEPRQPVSCIDVGSYLARWAAGARRAAAIPVSWWA